jgi:hypothetical protein
MVRLLLSLSAACALGCSASGGGGGSGAMAGGGGSSAGLGSGGGDSGGTGASGGSPPGEIGAACATNEDCNNPPDAECFTTIGGGPLPTITFPGGFCSKGCDPSSNDQECGDKAGCSSMGTASGGITVQLNMCSPPCADDRDCRQSEGYACFQILPGLGICVPP